MRLTGFIAKEHHRSRTFGGWVIAFASDNQVGLIRLGGTVVAPGHSGPGGWCRTTTVNGVGKRASSTLRRLSATIQQWVPAGRT